MKRAALARLIGFDIAVTIVVLDQITKFLVVHHVFGGHPSRFFAWLFEKAEPFSAPVRTVTDFFNLVMVWNSGISFGIFQSQQNLMPFILSAFALIVAAGFSVWLWRGPSFFRAVTVGLIVGGAVGNIWDRLRFGAVVDFLDFHVAGAHWPAFNVADMAVSVGVVLLLVQQIFYNRPNSSGEGI